jgi:multidrug resistance efflux pump
MSTPPTQPPTSLSRQTRPLRADFPATETAIDVPIHRLMPPRKRKRHIAYLLLVLLAIAVLILKFTPYQQTVVGNGKVGVFRVMDRTQTIDAQIGGQLVEWHVQEGDVVQKGQLLAKIRDTESRFLSPERVVQLRRQSAAQRQRKREELKRLAKLEEQIVQLRKSQPEQISAATGQERQAGNAQNIARQSLRNTEKQLESVQKVAVLQAVESLRQAKIRVGQADIRVEQGKVRVGQAQDRLQQAEQTVKADKVALEAQTLQRERIARLYKEGLRSGREDELAERDLVAAGVKWEQARQTVEIALREIKNVQNDVRALEKEAENARRQVRVVEATNTQADIQVQQARNQVNAARSALLNATESIGISGNNKNRIIAETQATIVAAEGNMQAARANIAQIEDSLSKAELELDNMQQRSTQESIYAPVDGRVSRIGKTIGQGQTVKKDDELLEIVPETKDQAVELLLNEMDAPLVTVGRKVRLQFVGFPAATVPGFPQTMTGTFVGVVANIDPVDDGSGKVRTWVKPDLAEIQRGEKPWPLAAQLRPGTVAIGWIALDTVPLWYELWRQFNGFSPNFREANGFQTTTETGKETGNKKIKLFKSGEVKIPKR